MKKLISIFAIFCFAFSFSQIKIDLTKKQAYERFKNSNVRKACSIKLNEFDKIYKYSLETDVSKKLSDCVIFKNIKNREQLEKISRNYFRGTEPYYKDGTPKCSDCSMIIFFDYKNVIEYNFEI